MKIGYVTTYDAGDVHAWSGLGLHIGQALENQGLDVVRIGPLHSKFEPLILAKFLWAGARGLKYKRERSPSILKAYAREVQQRVKGLDLDVIFSPGSVPLAYLQSHIPVVFWTDATFAAIANFYPSMTNLSPQTMREGNTAEQSALNNCRLAIYSSPWAAQSALERYQVDPKKVKVVPFGANLDSHRTESDIVAILAERRSQPLRLLLIGVEWERKGGDYAVALAENLFNRGVPVELSIAGCAVPAALKRPFVKECGYLSKAKPAEKAELERLLRTSHFLIQPSRAECFALIVAEAASFGAPVFASNAGGFPTLIPHGVTGFCFPLPVFVESAAQEIMRLRQDTAAYETLALNAFRESSEKLNWDYAGRQVKTLLEAVVHR